LRAFTTWRDPVTFTVWRKQLADARERINIRIKAARTKQPAVWPKRLALRTGRVGEVANQPRASALGWMFDSAGEPRVAVMAPDAGQRTVALRGSDGWRTLKLPDADGRGWRPEETPRPTAR
jgi:hypothetical protein